MNETPEQILAPTDLAPIPQAPGDAPVLWVDDDENICRLARRQLAKRGFDVDVASSGEEALRMAREKAYGVVATDLTMPTMDGLSLIERLTRQNPGISTILVTGAHDLELPQHAWLDESLVSVIVKPWDSTELCGSISRALQVTTAKRRSGADEELDGMRILLVEDSASDARLIQHHLEKGFPTSDVRWVRRVRDAVECLERESWHVVLTDLGLPDARGVDAVRRLHLAARGCPIIVVSGRDDDEVALEAVRLGAQDHLQKDELRTSLVERTVRYAIERKRAENRLSFLANHDPLTELANREHFRGLLNHALARARRNRSGFAVVFVDLDHFKSINDGLGHHAGDAILREVGHRLKQAVREPDTVARLGGDEFAVLLEEIDSPKVVEVVAERIGKVLSEPIQIAGEQLEVTGSVGVALYPDNGDGVDVLLRAADDAMYEAKADGRNTFRVARTGLAEDQRRNYNLSRQLRHALDRDEFVLHYQPQLNVATGEFDAAEALIRWERPGEPRVAPDQFIAVLEELGLIEDVGFWVIDEACRQLAEWRARGLAIERVAVNLSPLQFSGGSLVSGVRKVLDRHRLAPERLELEITEGALMKDTAYTHEQLTELHRIGVRIAIDDFGTGYSSLSYLHRFPVQILKVDRSFVGEVTESKEASLLVSSIIGLAHRLGLEVVAEGVETEGQLGYLRLEGCDRTQGYLHQKPGPADTVDHIFSRQEPGGVQGRLTVGAFPGFLQVS